MAEQGLEFRFDSQFRAFSNHIVYVNVAVKGIHSH